MPGMSSSAPSGTTTVDRGAGSSQRPAHGRDRRRRRVHDACADAGDERGCPGDRRDPEERAPIDAARSGSGVARRRRGRPARDTASRQARRRRHERGQHDASDRRAGDRRQRASGVAPARVTIAATESAPAMPSATTPSGGRRYCSTPVTAAATSDREASPTRRAILSYSPNVAIANSLNGCGTMSMTNEPTARIGLLVACDEQGDELGDGEEDRRAHDAGERPPRTTNQNRFRSDFAAMAPPHPRVGEAPAAVGFAAGAAADWAGRARARVAGAGSQVRRTPYRRPSEPC